MKKGTFGYINQRKKSQLLKSILAFFIAFSILIFGYLINKNSMQNIFTILGMLAVLPATKVLISYIVVLPYHSVKQEAYDEVSAVKGEADQLLTDLVLTSAQKVMNLSFLLVKEDKLIGLSEHKKASEQYIQEYLQRLMDGRALPFKVKITKDYSAFLSEISNENDVVIENKDMEELHNLIMSLLV